jgi:hypothetical protein
MPRKSRDHLSQYGARNRAKAWLHLQLDHGRPLLASDLKTRARQGRFCWRTLERARAEIGVRAIKLGKPSPWFVVLDPTIDPRQPSRNDKPQFTQCPLF